MSKREDTWTKEELNVLIDGFNNNYTCTQISDMLKGRSKSAVVGKLDRLKLSLTKRNQALGIVHKPKPKLKPAISQRPAIKGVKLPGLEFETKMISDNPVRLIDLKPHHCKQPVKRNTEGEWLLCAERRCHDKSPYCKFHHEENYRRPVYKVKK